MPAKYVETGKTWNGCGVKFNLTPSDKTTYYLYSIGFNRDPSRQYVAKRTKKNMLLICRFILAYNKEHFPLNTPDEMDLPEEILGELLAEPEQVHPIAKARLIQPRTKKIPL